MTGMEGGKTREERREREGKRESTDNSQGFVQVCGEVREVVK